MRQNTMLFLDLRRAETDYPVSRRKLRQLIKDKRLTAFRLDGKIVFRREDLERLLTTTPVDADLDRLVNEAVAGILSK